MRRRRRKATATIVMAGLVSAGLYLHGSSGPAKCRRLVPLLRRALELGYRAADGRYEGVVSRLRVSSLGLGFRLGWVSLKALGRCPLALKGTLPRHQVEVYCPSSLRVTGCRGLLSY